MTKKQTLKNTVNLKKFLYETLFQQHYVTKIHFYTKIVQNQAKSSKYISYSYMQMSIFVYIDLETECLRTPRLLT